MANTATITKFSVDELHGANDFTAAIQVVVQDSEAKVLLDKTYSERYNSSTAIDTIKQKLQAKFVVDWNKYKAEKAIFDAGAFDTLVSELQTTANVFVNQ